MGTEGDAFNAALGRQLRAEIAASGGSIAGMARSIGIARSALDNYVNGKRSIPVSIVYEIAALLGVDPHLIVVRAEERLAAERSTRLTATDVVGTPEDGSGVRGDYRLVSRKREDDRGDDEGDWDA